MTASDNAIIAAQPPRTRYPTLLFSLLSSSSSSCSYWSAETTHEEQEQADQVPCCMAMIVCNFLISDLFLAIQARIKKIMQKDEEVGKVAQATPIVICA